GGLRGPCFHPRSSILHLPSSACWVKIIEHECHAKHTTTKRSTLAGRAGGAVVAARVVSACRFERAQRHLQRRGGRAQCLFSTGGSAVSVRQSQSKSAGDHRAGDGPGGHALPARTG